MRPRLGLVVTAALVLTACGTSTATTPSSTTQTSIAITSTTAAAQLAARQLLLTAADFTSNWTDKPTPTPDGRLVTLEAEKNACIGLPARSPSGGTTFYGDTFTLLTSKVTSSVNSGSPAKLNQYLDAINNSADFDCVANVYNAELQKALVASGRPEATVSSALTSIPFLADDQVSALRITSTITDNDTVTKTFTDTLQVLSGNYLVSVSNITATNPPSAAAQLELLNAVNKHLSAAKL